MEIVLVDTSAWINFFKAKETAASLFLKNNLGNFIIATCPVVVQEILQGVLSEKEFKLVNSYFSTLTRLDGNPYELAMDAARLYREIRKTGFTIRKSSDCLIASFAIKHSIKLLHDDKDFYHIATNSDLLVQIV